YDTVISNYLGRKFQLRFREEFTVGGRLIQTMRYGENPHQDSAFYKEPLMSETGVCYAQQQHGKELSFNNIVDLNSAEELLKEFKRP
ncbi:bifunctional phosphoribosylaminoimidazolecarboxamide formyltransferase/IMP cyclohydrolase, partial [Acinetobacter baumannii]